MKLFAVKNNETGKTKGLNLTSTLDLTYFALIQETINHNPDDFDNDEIKGLMGGHDFGWYIQFQNELDQLSDPLTAGRYTITPIN